MFRLLTLALCLIIAGLSGCYSEGPQPVSGTVTVDSQPLASGEILFVPEDGQQGAEAGTIENGKFALKSKTGKMKVQITSQREIAGKTERGAMGESLAKTEQFLPAKYNTATVLTADVPEGGKSDYEFALDSK